MCAMYYRVPRQLYGDALFQEGVLSTSQLVGAGMNREALSSLVRAGRWQRLHRGVYATFSGPVPREAVLWAAVLAAGPGAMLSYQSAAEAWKLADKPSRPVHVTVPNQRRVKPIRGVIVHYSDRAEQARHPVAMPPRTLIEETVLDLADAAASLDDAIAWITSALGRNLTRQAQLGKALTARRRVRWRSELTELLSPDAAGMHSILEVRYHRDVERPHGLPAGTRQAQFAVGSRRAFRDRFYENYLTVVELDGRATHTLDKRWDDIRRDNATSAVGILTLRYGWLDITTRPCHVAAEVALALAKRGYTGAKPCSPGCPVGKVTGRYRPTAS
jgi:Transcriptional regulator, AbiEi antitoxin